ncbi:MAG: cyclic nucleotide-binding domain-containing protein [Oligoflexia bacterium]|nr:cyclic nucleotide-binding domain-containing protein [Oligoflexia bacterium]
MEKKNSIFMLAVNDEKTAKEVSDVLRVTYDGATIYVAYDGAEALAKMSNVKPDVLIAELELRKISGADLITTVMKDKKFNGISVVALSDIPDQDRFADDVADGRLKFLAKPSGAPAIIDSVSRALSHANGNTIDSQFKLVSLSPGEKLFSQGEQAKSAFLVKKGRLRAMANISGKLQTLGDACAGEFVGEMAYINGQVRSADVEALEQCELVEIPIGTLDLLLFTKPAWSKALMKTLARRLSEANQNKA